MLFFLILCQCLNIKRLFMSGSFADAGNENENGGAE
jgi:hypothetical protein